jgi:hypothetical protein
MSKQTAHRPVPPERVDFGEVPSQGLSDFCPNILGSHLAAWLQYSEAEPPDLADLFRKSSSR